MRVQQKRKIHLNRIFSFYSTLPFNLNWYLLTYFIFIFHSISKDSSFPKSSFKHQFYLYFQMISPLLMIMPILLQKAKTYQSIITLCQTNSQWTRQTSSCSLIYCNKDRNHNRPSLRINLKKMTLKKRRILPYPMWQIHQQKKRKGESTKIPSANHSFYSSKQKHKRFFLFWLLFSWSWLH